MGFANLNRHSLVRVLGEGAEKLLNDTLTGTIDRGMAGEGRWFGLLSAQGKLLVEGLATFGGGAFWFDMESAYAGDFIKRMKLYRLRAKAEIEDMTATLAPVWTDDASAVPAGIIYRDVRHATLGQRYIADRVAPNEGNPDPAYTSARIAAGIAEMGSDFDTGEVFPHDIGMDLLGGVDFKKGCYIGQEVVSRMEHRGTARRRPVIVSGLPEGAAAGAPVLVGEREAGTIGAVVGGKAVALLRLDRITDPEGTSVGGLPISLSLPDWASYEFAGS